MRVISGEARGIGANAWRGALRVAEVGFAAVVTLRNALYDRGVLSAADLGRPAISVGNITAGGTGKTPVVQWLARNLQAAGRRPAVLLRGYTRGGGMSDEAALLEESLPGVRVVADADRQRGAAAALVADGAIDCFLLDDGMQHRRARRQGELVLINARAPFGIGHLHPRGLLREPLASLRRATAVLITHASEVSAGEVDALQQRLREHTEAPIFHCDHRHAGLVSEAGAEALERLEQERFLAFAGIGNPASLERALEGYGDRYAGFVSFADHHAYTADDLQRLESECLARGASVLVTTEKDWVKLRCLPRCQQLNLWRLQLGVTFWEGEEGVLLRLLCEAIAARRN